MALQTQVAFRPGFVFLFILLIGGHLCWKATAWEHSEPDDLGDFDVEVDMDEDVIILDDSTFKYAVESREFLLVQFYAPWCQHSKKAAPEFAAAAKILMARESMNETVGLAKVDGIANKKLVKKYGVTKYPAFRFFVQGVLHKKDITLFTSMSIVRFIFKKVHPPVIPLETKKALKQVKEEAPFTVVGYFDQHADAAAFKTFVEVAVEDDYTEYFYVWNKKIMKKENIERTPTLMIYRHFDSPETEYTGSWDKAGIEEAIRAHKKPTVIDLNGDTNAEIFSNTLPKLLLVHPDQESMDAMMEVAKTSEFETKYMFVTVQEDADPDFKTFLGVDEDKKDPEFWIYADDKGEDRARKYRLEPPYTAESVEKFMRRRDQGKLKEVKKSAQVQDGWDDQPVKELVASQWDTFVQQNKHVIVEFYQPDSEQCKALEPKYEECAKYLDQEVPNDVIVARIDASENEVEGFEIEEYPTVFLLKRGKKSTPRLVNPRHFQKDASHLCKRLLKMLDMLKSDSDSEKEEKSEL